MGMELTNEQWTRLRHLIPSPNRKNLMVEGGPDVTQGTFSTASYGCCAQALRGRIFHYDILLNKRAIVGSKSGSNKAFLKRFSPNCLRIFTSWVESIFAKRLSMAVSHPQKKGPFCRQYKAWQRHQDHGNCRRFWSSCRL